MKSPALRPLSRFRVLPLLCFGMAWFVGNLSLVERLGWVTLDWRTNLRVRYQAPADSRISVILFEDNTELNLTPWPPDRAVHADLIKLLSLARPSVITWDVLFDATREGDGDAEMGRAAAMAQEMGVKVITGSVTAPDPSGGGDDVRGPTRPLTHVTGDITKLAGDEHALLPFTALRKESLYGFVDTPPGEDGFRREIPLVVRVGDAVYASLSLQTLMAYFDVSAEAVRVNLGDAVYLSTPRHGELRVPVSAAGFFLLNYRYDQNASGLDFGAMNYFGAMVKLHERFVENTGVPAMPPLEGGIVFIGQTVTGKADAGPTPRSPMSPLVLIHANLVNNVLASDYARRAPSWMVFIGAVLLGYGGVLVGQRRPVWAIAAFGVIAVACYVTATFVAWIKWSLWLPLVWPVLGFVALQFIVIGSRVLREQQAREQVKQMFGSYLSPELLTRMMKNGRNIAAVSSERRAVTILFSDLRDFTSLTETLKDDALIAQLNEYLAAMVECIHREGGTLHKFIGDAVMAVWGDLESAGKENDAQKAARAALAMQATLERLNRKWLAGGQPALRMGIGINHGIVLVGNIGSPRRMEFTAIGDAVNLASRLESLNKELKTSILVGESMRELLGAAFHLRRRGSHPAKGKAVPVEIYELVGPSMGAGEHRSN